VPIELPLYAWAWIAVLAAAAVFSILRTIAGNIRFEIEVHDLHVRVRDLHAEYDRRLRVLVGQQDEDVVGVDIIDDAPNAEPPNADPQDAIELPADEPQPAAAAA